MATAAPSMGLRGSVRLGPRYLTIYIVWTGDTDYMEISTIWKHRLDGDMGPCCSFPVKGSLP